MAEFSEGGRTQEVGRMEWDRREETVRDRCR